MNIKDAYHYIPIFLRHQCCAFPWAVSNSVYASNLQIGHGSRKSDAHKCDGPSSSRAENQGYILISDNQSSIGLWLTDQFCRWCSVPLQFFGYTSISFSWSWQITHVNSSTVYTGEPTLSLLTDEGVRGGFNESIIKSSKLQQREAAIQGRKGGIKGPLTNDYGTIFGIGIKMPLTTKVLWLFCVQEWGKEVKRSKVPLAITNGGWGVKSVWVYPSHLASVDDF